MTSHGFVILSISIVEIPAMETESPPPTPPIDEHFDEDEDLPDVPGDDEDEDDEEEDDDAGDNREPPDELKQEAEKGAAASVEGEKKASAFTILSRMVH